MQEVIPPNFPEKPQENYAIIAFLSLSTGTIAVFDARYSDESSRKAKLMYIQDLFENAQLVDIKLLLSGQNTQVKQGAIGIVNARIISRLDCTRPEISDKETGEKSKVDLIVYTGLMQGLAQYPLIREAFAFIDAKMEESDVYMVMEQVIADEKIKLLS